MEITSMRISADEAWRYGSEERSLMIQAGFEFEHDAIPVHAQQDDSPDWHHATPEELRRNNIRLQAWAFLHVIMNDQPLQHTSFCYDALEIDSAVKYLEKKAKEAADSADANNQVSRVRRRLADICAITEFAA